MRAIRQEVELADAITAARREAKAAFGNDEVYLEKFIVRAKHVEVQILGDTEQVGYSYSLPHSRYERRGCTVGAGGRGGGVDAVDSSTDSMSGLTSQPSLGAKLVAGARMATAGNPMLVGTPMQGAVITVSVRVG